MSTLAETISSALRAAGPQTEDRLRDVITEFDGFGLTPEERLAAVATAVAAIAALHHKKHKKVYLDAVQTWALEVAAEIQPRPVPVRARPPRAAAVEAGAEALVNGVDALIELMVCQDVRTQDRLVTELALVSRLLGQNDANAIHLAMLAILNAMGEAAFQAGAMVVVPIRETAAILTRDVELGRLSPHGCA